MNLEELTQLDNEAQSIIDDLSDVIYMDAYDPGTFVNFAYKVKQLTQEFLVHNTKRNLTYIAGADFGPGDYMVVGRVTGEAIPIEGATALDHIGYAIVPIKKGETIELGKHFSRGITDIILSRDSDGQPPAALPDTAHNTAGL